MGAVVKARYGRGAKSVDAAKAHVRYMAHRPDEWGNRQYRELWGAEDRKLDKAAAYEDLDRAGGDGSYLYRLVLSPDPRTQDADQALDLHAWSESVMDDKEHRHVHVVALMRDRLDVDDFRQMRAAADANASGQHRQRDRDQVDERDR
jgi:hypothetical protein